MLRQSQSRVQRVLSEHIGNSVHGGTGHFGFSPDSWRLRLGVGIVDSCWASIFASKLALIEMLIAAYIFQ